MNDIRAKLVIVGDGACGKTCLLIVFARGTFPEVSDILRKREGSMYLYSYRRIFLLYLKVTQQIQKQMVKMLSQHYGIQLVKKIMTVYVHYPILILMSSLSVSLLIPLIHWTMSKKRYTIDLALFLFFLTLCLQWISEVLHFCPGIPFLLVGTKKDLRDDPAKIEELRKTNQKPVTTDEVKRK